MFCMKLLAACAAIGGASAFSVGAPSLALRSSVSPPPRLATSSIIPGHVIHDPGYESVTSDLPHTARGSWTPAQPPRGQRQHPEGETWRLQTLLIAPPTLLPSTRQYRPGTVSEAERVQTAPAISPASSFTPSLRVVAGAATIRPMRAAAQRPAVEMAAKKKSIKDLAPAELKGKKVRSNHMPLHPNPEPRNPSPPCRICTINSPIVFLHTLFSSPPGIEALPPVLPLLIRLRD